MRLKYTNAQAKSVVISPFPALEPVKFYVEPIFTVYIRAYAEQTVTERTDVYRSTRFFAPKMFFRSFKVTNANIETKLEQMCCIHTRLVVCALRAH